MGTVNDVCFTNLIWFLGVPQKMEHTPQMTPLRKEDGAMFRQTQTAGTWMSSPIGIAPFPNGEFDGEISHLDSTSCNQLDHAFCTMYSGDATTIPFRFVAKASKARERPIASPQVSWSMAGHAGSLQQDWIWKLHLGGFERSWSGDPGCFGHRWCTENNRFRGWKTFKHRDVPSFLMRNPHHCSIWMGDEHPKAVILFCFLMWKPSCASGILWWVGQCHQWTWYLGLVIPSLVILTQKPRNLVLDPFVWITGTPYRGVFRRGRDYLCMYIYI